MVKGTWIRSPFVFVTSAEAATAESEAVQKFLMTGQIPSTSLDTSEQPPEPIETIHDLLTSRVQWLKDHRSGKHAKDNEYLFSQAFKFAPEWEEKPVADLGADEVEKWAEKWAHDLEERGKSRLTVNKALVAIQSAWNCPWGTRRAERKYPYNPFALVERFSIEHRAKILPSDKQVIKVVEKAKGEGRLFLELLKATGARPGEARNLQWTDVNISQKPFSVVLYTRKKKGGSRTPRRIPIEPELTNLLRKWRKKNPKTVYVFQQDYQEAPRDKHWATDVQREACEAAKVPYFNPHSWRHWHASKLLKTMNLAQIQKRLGHENVSTTDKYIHELVGI
jgi:integrase